MLVAEAPRRCLLISGRSAAWVVPCRHRNYQALGWTCWQPRALLELPVVAEGQGSAQRLGGRRVLAQCSVACRRCCLPFGWSTRLNLWCWLRRVFGVAPCSLLGLIGRCARRSTLRRTSRCFGLTTYWPSRRCLSHGYCWRQPHDRLWLRSVVAGRPRLLGVHCG